MRDKFLYRGMLLRMTIPFLLLRRASGRQKEENKRLIRGGKIYDLFLCLEDLCDEERKKD